MSDWAKLSQPLMQACSISSHGPHVAQNQPPSGPARSAEGNSFRKMLMSDLAKFLDFKVWPN